MNTQKGNVLFLILIAVALFAALSYAVTQSTRGGGNADDESALIDSAAMTQFGASVATAIMRMRLAGVEETDFCFYTGNNSTDYNHATCSDNTNNVFHADGGGVSYQDPPNGLSSSTEWEFNARPQVYGQGTTVPSSSGNDTADLVMVLRDVDTSICEAINENVGISGIPEDSGDLNLDRFDGDYTQADGIDGCNPNCTTVGDSPIGAVSANFGCILEQLTGENLYFHVLLAR